MRRSGKFCMAIVIIILLITLSGFNITFAVGDETASTTIISSGQIKTPEFFKTIKNPNGVWSFIDQYGAPFFSLGVTAIRYDNRPNYEANIITKYGSLSSWGTATVAKLKTWGFNTIGAWSASSTLNKGLPYTFCLNIGQYSYNHGVALNRRYIPDVFDPRWAPTALEAAETLIMNPPTDVAPSGSLINDKNLIGYFISNDFYVARWSPMQSIAYNEAMFKGDIDELLAKQTTDDPGKARLIALGYNYHEWLKEYADLFYKTTVNAVKAVDPNHLIIGARGLIYSPQEEVEAAGKYVDAISLNFYQYFLNPSIYKQQLENYHEWSGKPIMITEWSIRAIECDPDVLNSGDVGPLVSTQNARGTYYEEELLGISSLPFIIGMHWFMWTDKMVGGENANFGLVNVNDEPYGFIPYVQGANIEIINGR